jgi:hypothetical protein
MSHCNDCNGTPCPHCGGALDAADPDGFRECPACGAMLSAYALIAAAGDEDSGCDERDERTP